MLRLARLAGPLRWRLLLAALAGALATLCGVGLLATSAFLLARASQHPSITALSVAVVAVRGLSIGRAGFRYAERLAAHDAAFRILARTRVALWRQLAVLAPSGLAAFRSGDLLARLVSDVDTTQDLFIRGIAPPLAAGLAGAGAVLACLLFLIPAGLVLAAGLLIAGIVVPLISLHAARSASRSSAPARGQFAAATADLLAGAADLAAFGATEFALDRAESANRELTRQAKHSAAASGAGSGLGALAAGLTLWAVLLLGVQATGASAVGRVPLAVLTLTALASFEAVTGLPTAALALSQARTSAKRITTVLDAPNPVTEPESPLPLPAGPVNVRLTDVRVRYELGAPFALEGISLDLTPGKRMALTGPNGAGKSTIAAVLLRFRDLTSGSILLNGHDLASYRCDDVRRVIAGCQQDAHVFDTSIACNLRIARPEAGESELMEVLHRVGLGDWIGTLPFGVDTELGPDGAAVSGGQRQRIVLARALLADPPILILDEPAAHLDLPGRRSLMADLLSATAGRTTLLITHDLDDLDQIDEIAVLNGGKITERGTHSQLLAANGWYCRMRSQPNLSGLT